MAESEAAQERDEGALQQQHTAKIEKRSPINVVARLLIVLLIVNPLVVLTTFWVVGTVTL